MYFSHPKSDMIFLDTNIRLKKRGNQYKKEKKKKKKKEKCYL